MNTKRVAEALNTISLAFAELAEAINQPLLPPAVKPEAGTAARPAPDTFSDGTPIEEPFMEEVGEDPIAPVLRATGGTEVPQGSLAQCPKHHILYREGKRGTKYCPVPSDDPAWRNEKGYCTITPKSARAWLAETAA